MMTLDQIEAALQSAGILFVKGKGGIIVCEFEDGFLLQNVNKHMKSLQITNTQVGAIGKLFPQILSGQLERLLVRNADTTRRAVMDFISLDEKAPMPLPGQVDARKPPLIPRMYAALEATADTSTNRVTLAIWGSELSVGNHRVDEAMLQMEITEADAEEIRKGRPIKEVLAGKDVHNVRVLYYDDNKVITGKSRRNHHLKSLDTLSEFFIKTAKEFDFKIVGYVFVHVEDDLSDSPSVKVGLKDMSPIRPKPGLKSAGKNVERFFLSLNLQPEFKDGKLKALRPIPDSITAQFIEGFTQRDKQALLKGAAKVRRQLQKALAAALKNAV
jgi:hypothetical protein